MKNFNNFYNKTMGQLLEEARLWNIYDSSANSVFSQIIDYISKNSKKVVGSDKGTLFYIISLNDIEPPFKFEEDKNIKTIKIYIQIFKTNKPTKGMYLTNKFKHNRKMFVRLTTEEFNVIKNKPANDEQRKHFEFIKDDITETIKHELEHLSEFATTYRKTVRKELRSKFNDDYSYGRENNGYVDEFIINVKGSDIYQKVLDQLENLDGSINDTFKIKLAKITSYVLTNSEISAKISGLKMKCFKNKTNIEEELLAYIQNMLIFDTKKYNDTVLNDKIFVDFFKFATLFILNCFIEAALTRYPIIDKNFNTIKIFGAEYKYDGTLKEFK